MTHGDRVFDAEQQVPMFVATIRQTDTHETVIGWLTSWLADLSPIVLLRWLLATFLIGFALEVVKVFLR